MKNRLEMQKVLLAVDKRFGIANLVQWHIPYLRQAEYLLEAMEQQLVEERDGILFLTESGREFIEHDEHRIRSKDHWNDPLAEHRTQPLDVNEIYVPKE